VDLYSGCDSDATSNKIVAMEKRHLKDGFNLYSGCAMQRICDVAFNIAIPSQRQRTSLLTIASENIRRNARMVVGFITTYVINAYHH
jgi:hypothetical protein